MGVLDLVTWPPKRLHSLQGDRLLAQPSGGSTGSDAIEDTASCFCGIKSLPQGSRSDRHIGAFPEPGPIGPTVRRSDSALRSGFVLMHNTCIVHMHCAYAFYIVHSHPASCICIPPLRLCVGLVYREPGQDDGEAPSFAVIHDVLISSSLPD